MILLNENTTTDVVISGEFTANQIYNLYIGDTKYEVTDISTYPSRYAKFVVPAQSSSILDGTYELYLKIDAEIEDYICRGIFRIKRNYIETSSTFEDTTNNIIFEE